MSVTGRFTGGVDVSEANGPAVRWCNGGRERGIEAGRRRLPNPARATGALNLAGWLGAAFQSWWVFGAFLLLFLVLGVWGGIIRMAASRR